RVKVDDAVLLQRFQAFDRGQQLHAVVGRQPEALGELFLGYVMPKDGPVAAGPRVADARAVRKNLNVLHDTNSNSAGAISRRLLRRNVRNATVSYSKLGQFNAITLRLARLTGVHYKPNLYGKVGPSGLNEPMADQATEALGRTAQSP